MSEEFLQGYLDRALWLGISNEEGTADLDISDTHIAEDALADMRKDCERFVKEAGDLLDGIEDSQAGHDFWLTRNHHGAGFWDRGHPDDIGDKLTKLAHGFGDADLYLGDDGLIYCS